jgi:hypothetical protein
VGAERRRLIWRERGSGRASPCRDRRGGNRGRWWVDESVIVEVAASVERRCEPAQPTRPNPKPAKNGKGSHMSARFYRGRLERATGTNETTVHSLSDWEAAAVSVGEKGEET